MTTPKTDALMALADRYAFHIPGSQHSDEARAALLAALQEQAREGHIEALKRARDTAMDQSAKSHIPECGHFAVIAQDLDWAIGNVDSINTSKERVENDRANVQVQAREGEAVANSAILARGRFHAFKGENGEPDDWEWFEEGTNCEHGCIDAVIVRADAIAAPQPAQPESIECDCGRIHKKTRYGWACSEPAQPEQGTST